MSDRLLGELELYREGYELRGKLLAAYRTGGRPSERVLAGLARVADQLAALDTPEPQGAASGWLAAGLAQAVKDTTPEQRQRVIDNPSGFIQEPALGCSHGYRYCPFCHPNAG